MAFRVPAPHATKNKKLPGRLVRAVPNGTAAEAYQLFAQRLARMS
jgi:hypothetical protein